MTASQNANGNYNAVAQTNNVDIAKRPQSIRFDSIPGQAVGAASFPIRAEATSGLPVTFSTSSTACSVTGSTVTIKGIGQCDIDASQAGDNNNAAADNKRQSFSIAGKTQHITFDPLIDRALGDSPFFVSASSDASPTLTVALSSLTGGVCSISGNWVTLLTGGDCTIAADQRGAGDYASALQVTRTFKVRKKSQTITFTAPEVRLLGDASFIATASADSKLPVTLSSATTNVCTVNAMSPATVTLKAIGQCTIVATQSGDASYKDANQESRTIKIVASAGTSLGSEFLDQSLPTTTTMRASQPYTVTIRMINTGTTTWTAATTFRLGFFFDPQDSRLFSSTARAFLTGPVLPGDVATFTIPVTAPSKLGNYAFQWKMVKDDFGWFGPPSQLVNIAVVSGSGPSAQLTVSPVNARMQGTTPVTLTFTGSGSESGRVVTQLELLRDSGVGFEPTALNTVTGGASSLAMSFTMPATAGSYKFKLRSTDDQNRQTDSDIAVVNVNADSSTLLGSVTGVRLDTAGKPQLVGWVCQKGSTQQLNYQVLLDYPRRDIGADFLEGTGTVRTANLATEADNLAVQAACATPGTAHHFNVDLSPYTGTKAGRALYVRVIDGASAPIATLPCEDNSCTMPGSLRLALSTPTDGQQITGPSTVFVRTQLSGGSGPYDEVALSVDGNWVAASPDGAVGAFSTTTAQLEPRSAPYAVEARVRQGNMTLYSQVSRVTMVSGVAPTITLDTGLDDLTIGSPSDLVLTANTSGITTGFSVKFFANGQQVVAGVANGSTWRGTWTNIAANKYVVTAQLSNGSGQLIATSPPVTITAGYTATPSDSTPLAVAIAPPHTGNADAGTLPGNLSVTPAGAAAYSLQIVVPPGTAGMQPSLSLDYSSSAPNSMLGLGWSLGGVSSIHRCGKTIAQDGVNGRISFDNEDRLCLDGKRLVLANVGLTDASYWADNAEFRTELDEFSRITAVVTNGKRSFRVELKNGRVMTYGSTDDSYVKAIVGNPNSGTATPGIKPVKSGAQSWALDRIADPMGNYIKFGYEQDPVTGEHHPLILRYGAAGLAAHAAVVFSYESRNDAWTRYIDETRNDLRTRLARIKTYVGSNLDGDPATAGTVVRDYALSYEYSKTSGRSMLNQVQASARNPASGVMETMPATTFDWGRPDPSKQPGFVSRGYWAGGPIMTTYKTANGITNGASHTDYFAFSDFEHHGFTDVLEKRVASQFTNTPEGPNGTNSIPPGTLRASYRYFHNTGNGFTQYNYKLNTGDPFVVLDIGDFDGDGALDLLVSSSAGRLICLSPLGRAGALGAPGSTIEFACDPARTSAGSNTVGQEPYIVDMLGDGRSAVYGPTNINGRAYFCLQTSPCIADDSPPNVLSGNLRDDGTSEFSQNAYVSMQQMVDFAGIGKPYDVRWSNPHSVKYTYVDNEQHYDPHWENLAPTVTMNNFRLPGSTSNAGVMLPFVYPAFASPPVTSVIPPYEFEKPADGAGLSGDFNGSGYTGLAFGFLDISYTSGVKIYNRAEMTLCLSTGRALDCRVRKKYSGNQYPRVVAVGNFIGDGQPSILVSPLTYASGASPVPTGGIKMCSVYSDDTTGDANDAGINCVSWTTGSAPVAGQIHDKILYVDLLGTGRMQMLYYHGGYVTAGNVWQEDGRWELFEPVDLAFSGQALDRIHQVKNGLGAKSTVTYADGLASGIVTMTNSVALAYPQHLTANPGKVVQRISHENGVAGKRSTVYAYQDDAIDVAGRGSLGFAKVTSTDEQTGIVTTSTYGLVWPYTGNALTTNVSSGGTILSSTVNTLAVKDITQANGAKTTFVYASNSKLCRKDLDGSDLGCSSTDSGYDSWGNQLSQATMYSVGGAGSGYAGRIDNTFKSCTANWMPSLPQQVTTTKTDPVSGTLTRTVAYDYDCASGLIKTSTVEPDNGNLRVLTTYGRSNVFGLVNTTTQSWLHPVNGATRVRTVSDVTYDANGRYPLFVKNALGHQEGYTYEPGTGAKKTYKNVNGLGSSWVSDGFGRVSKEIRPDGNEVRSYFKQCASDCPLQATLAQVIDTFHGGDRIAVPTVSYSDAAGHMLRTLTWGFDGTVVNVDQRYDMLGRLSETDQPRFEGATAFLASRMEYDILNRVVRSWVPDELGTLQLTRNDYTGFVTVATNALLQTRTETRNVVGQLLQVKDANNKLTKFGYEPFGALNNTIDPNGNVIQVEYDLWGRKTQLTDPDLGTITYSVDPVGRTYQQITPKLKPSRQGGGTLAGVVMNYDDLDRMIARSEPDLNSYWKYDGAANGVGKLQKAYTGTESVPDYERTHTYDSLGRPLVASQRLQSISYTAQNFYDTWGRPIQQVYQRGTDAAKKFDLRYNNKGYLARLERGSQALWKVTEQDAAARVTKTLLGNMLSQSRSFNVYTGRLSGASLTTPASVEHLSEGYTYDLLGNVLTRDQHWDGVGFHETFEYDKLNRLWTSTVQDQAKQTFTYDDAGNMLSKTGVGTGAYTYPPQGADAVRPHAVQSITGIAGSFVYDKNGNLTSSPGRAATWTSFDMPLKLTKGTTTADFVYGPEHQRTRQIRSDGSSVIYAGAQEVETNAGQVTVKTYWPFGVGVEVDRPGAAVSELNWTHLDRLGSPVAMTDDKGNLREKFAYDAWGKRRTLNGASTPDTLDGQTDNRGFTGHEMLDQLDLVHMNGRVYDPLVGKFLSGDPFIQDPTNGQSYNRYSYVLNNPTNLTDPTGFLSAENCSNVGTCNKGMSLEAQKQVDPSSMVHLDNETANSVTKDANGGNKRSAKSPIPSTGQGKTESANSNTPVQGQQSGGDSPGINQVIIPGKRTPDNTSPWGLGVEWLTGTGPRTHTFTDGDPFAEMLRKHRHIQSVIQRVKSGELKPKGRDPYSVGGLIGIPLYFHDYSNLLTGGNTGNLAVTFLGSYGLSYEVNDEILTMTITNSSTISSATHPPVLGYTQWWRQNIEPTLNRQFESGPLSKTSQTIILHENIGGDRK